jgi:superoxide dismutase, Fe-Mn family
MQWHHDKYHGAYVNNLNAALKDRPEPQAKPLHDLIAHLADLPEDVRTVVRNSADGHANYKMFWQAMGGKGGESDCDHAVAIARDFGFSSARSFAFFGDFSHGLLLPRPS